MQNSYSKSYKDAGVDITSGYRSVELIKKHIKRTYDNSSTSAASADSSMGGFGGLFSLSGLGLSGKDYSDPVLVSGTDGVGTKLKIAFLMDKHDTVGIDCVAMCVNDIICAGAKPLFFLDYLAVGKNIPEKIEQIVSGVAEGCVQAGCILIGGETAEHPGMMPEEEYDIAGFSVGITDRSKIPDKNNVKPGDIIIGLVSSGVHSNGFSLIRKVFGIDDKPEILKQKFSEFEFNKTLGEELLTPTKIYVKPVLTLFDKGFVRSLCNITGGGFYENLPRILNENTGVVIQKSAIEIPPVFQVIKALGNIPERDMFNTFNMGIGMCIITAPENTDEALRILNSSGEKAVVIGEINSGFSGLKII
jgi:phosphoribosylformylglycinamidine cyclo-ligase